MPKFDMVIYVTEKHHVTIEAPTEEDAYDLAIDRTYDYSTLQCIHSTDVGECEIVSGTEDAE